jgi:hypothetical protein
MLLMAGMAVAAPGDIEVRAYTALAPTFAEQFGAGLAVEAGTLPESWLLVGGRTVWGDVIYLDSKAILGGSISLTGPGQKDLGMRGFGAVWLETGGNWVVGLSQKVATW